MARVIAGEEDSKSQAAQLETKKAKAINFVVFLKRYYTAIKRKFSKETEMKALKFIKHIGSCFAILLAFEVNTHATDEVFTGDGSRKRDRSPATSLQTFSAKTPIFVKRQKNLFSMRQLSYIPFHFLSNWVQGRKRLGKIADSEKGNNCDVVQFISHPDHQNAQQQFLWPYTVKFENIVEPFKPFVPKQYDVPSSYSHADIVFQGGVLAHKSPAYAIDENMFIVAANSFFAKDDEEKSLVKTLNISGLPCSLPVSYTDVGCADYTVYAHCFIHPQYQATKSTDFDVALVFLTPYLYVPDYYREDFLIKNGLSEFYTNIFRAISTPNNTVGLRWHDKYISPIFYHQIENFQDIADYSLVDQISTNVLIPEEQYIFQHYITLRENLLPFIMRCTEIHSAMVTIYNHLYDQLSNERRFRQYSQYAGERYKEKKLKEEAINLISQEKSIEAIHKITSLPIETIQKLKNNFEEGRVIGTIDMVRNLIVMGLPDEQIAKASGLPQKKIEEIRAGMTAAE